MMKTYARIEAGRVAELFATDGDIAQMFHPSLVWVEAPGSVSVGHVYAGGVFSAPPAPPPPAPAVPQSVTPAQAFTALDQAGKLGPLLAYIDAPDTPPLVRAVALGATEWRRDSLMLMTVAIVLGLTPAQVDDLFIAAALIEV